MIKSHLHTQITVLIFALSLMLSVISCMVIGATDLYAQARPNNPEWQSQSTARTISWAQSHHADQIMAVTANPHASDAAYQILRAGGNAMDAAVAAQLVLGLTEPQSSGLGGGAFMLYYDAKTKKLYSMDGRETAPKAADEELFINQGTPMEFWTAVLGGRSVGAPGTPKLLHTMHKRFGAKNWADLFTPALTLAQNGFEISPRLATLIEKDAHRLQKFDAARSYFFTENPDGTVQPKPAGTLLTNPAYAHSLELFQAQGDVAFYRGALAHDIISTVRRAPGNPGLLSLNDLKDYKIVERQNICAPYRGYRVCAMGEPSSGGLTLLQILGLVERFDLGTKINAQAIHLVAEASKLAFADRNYYMGDPDFIHTPGALLLDPLYLEQRSALIHPAKRLADDLVAPGTPPGWDGQTRQPDPSIKPPGTTHLSIIDAQGNIVSMTASVEQAFGARIMSGGFFLNNQLTDFAFLPIKDGQDVANRVQGGKRPRSSMTPVIMFGPDDTPVLVIGSAGGSRIIGYVLKSILHVVDWGASVDDALAAPHFLSRGTGIEMEPGLESLHPALRELGHTIREDRMNSGLTAIHILPGGKLHGAADPRREGKAYGK